VAARHARAAQVLRVCDRDVVLTSAHRDAARAAPLRALRLLSATLVDAPLVQQKILARADRARLQLIPPPADIGEHAPALAPHFQRDFLAVNFRVEFHKKLSGSLSSFDCRPLLKESLDLIT